MAERPLPPMLTRLVAALPDAVTAGVFLTLWIAPMRFGPHGVRNAMLVMLVEFVLVHASGFVGGVALASDVGRLKKVAAIAGFGLFYLLFVAAFAWSFGETWPYVAFGWLLAGKLVSALDPRRSGPDARQAMMSSWALSALFYILGAFATLFLPLPRLGLGPDAVAGLGLPGGGLWVEKPHIVIAFGVIYFSLLAWTKWRGTLLPARNLPAMSSAAD